MKIDYTTVTEITGCNVTQEQLDRMYTRYRFASNLCEGKEVLEVACGTGQGLGYLAKKAKRIIGGDYDVKIVENAKEYYKDRIEIREIDAQNLPFDDQSFDLVILYEAIYYLPQSERFISEAYRVLPDKGFLLICTANKDWSGFNPSLYSYKYYSAPELHKVLKQYRFSKVELYGDCLAKAHTARDAVLAFIKRVAVAFHLIPKTMKSKELLKRIFMGKLIPLPSEIDDGMAEYKPPVRISSDSPNRTYKVLYALAHK
jgi:ubiquinone/menaquinone biosynthesis C-methylase UbiE